MQVTNQSVLRCGLGQKHAFFNTTGVMKLGKKPSNIIRIEKTSLLAASFHTVCAGENYIHQVSGSLGFSDSPEKRSLSPLPPPKKGPNEALNGQLAVCSAVPVEQKVPQGAQESSLQSWTI